MMTLDRLTDLVNLPASTPPAIVWRAAWMAGLNAPHPEPDQTLEQWLDTLPHRLMEIMGRRLKRVERQITPDSTTSHRNTLQ